MVVMLVVVGILDIVEIHILRSQGKWPTKRDNVDQIDIWQEEE
jgi:hypothetical protein